MRRGALASVARASWVTPAGRRVFSGWRRGRQNGERTLKFADSPVKGAGSLCRTAVVPLSIVEWSTGMSFAAQPC